MTSVIYEILENAKFKSKTFRHYVFTKFNRQQIQKWPPDWKSFR